MTTALIPSSEQNATTEKNTFDNVWFLFFQDLGDAVRGALGLKLSGTLFNSIQEASNSGSSPTDLISYDLQSKFLSNNQDMLEIKVSGTFAANANNKTVQLVFGSQTIFDTTAIAANDNSWSFTATILRTSQTTQTINVTGIFNDVAKTTTTAGTQDTTGNINIKCIGTGSTTNDVTQKFLIIALTPYN